MQSKLTNRFFSRLQCFQPDSGCLLHTPTRTGHRVIPILSVSLSDLICASSSEMLMCLKQELATTAELVSGVLKCEQLKCEASHKQKRCG
jgi:hypothetical protein